MHLFGRDLRPSGACKSDQSSKRDGIAGDVVPSASPVSSSRDQGDHARERAYSAPVGNRPLLPLVSADPIEAPRAPGTQVAFFQQTASAPAGMLVSKTRASAICAPTGRSWSRRNSRMEKLAACASLARRAKTARYKTRGPVPRSRSSGTESRPKRSAANGSRSRRRSVRSASCAPAKIKHEIHKEI